MGDCIGSENVSVSIFNKEVGAQKRKAGEDEGWKGRKRRG